MASVPSPLDGPEKASPKLLPDEVALGGKEDSPKPLTEFTFLELLPTRLMYFFQCSACAFVIPFLIVYLSTMDIAPHQLGLLASLRYLAPMVSGPLFGFAADRITYKSVLVVVVVGYALNRLLFLLPVSDFWFFFAVILSGELIGSSMLPLIDSCALLTLKDRPDLYGKQRLWGSIGRCLMSPVGGFVAEYFSMQWNFIAHGFFMGALLTVLIFFYDAKNLPKNPDFIAALKGVAEHFDVQFAFFYFAIFINGSANGLLMNFLFIFLRTIGGDEFLMGGSLAINSIAEIIFFFFSGKIIAKYGCERVVAFALFVLIIRLFMISSLNEPLWILPIEFLHGITFALTYSTGTIYTAQVAPPGLGASFQGAFFGLFGAGAASGCLLGGIINTWFSLRVVFRVQSTIAIFALLLLLGAIYRKREKTL